MKFIKTDDTAIVNEFRQQLYRRFSAPIDGMWEALYIAASQTFLIENQTLTIGYCCIDNTASLTQIYMSEECNHLMDTVIQQLIESKLITSAKLSSIESVSFNACLSHSKSIQRNTLCFQYSNRALVKKSSMRLERASSEDILSIRTFFLEQIKFDDNFGYTERLVSRRELYMAKDAGIIVATGECRLSDSQLSTADIGVVVNKAYQCKGFGSQVLSQLVIKAQEAEREPICSTTDDNIASKKAIVKAGFYCSNIIFDINFLHTKPKKDDV